MLRQNHFSMYYYKNEIKLRLKILHSDIITVKVRKNNKKV